MYGALAATTATAWPTKYTRSPASTVCFGALRSGMAAAHGTRPHDGLTSAPVSTAVTPGIARAADTSMRAIRACAYGLRRMAACSNPANRMSSTYVAMPLMRRGSSTRFIARPTYGAVASATRHPRNPVGPAGRLIHRVDDVRVAGAAAQIAAQPVRDLLAARRGGPPRQRYPRHDH